MIDTWDAPAPDGKTAQELLVSFDKERQQRLLVLPAWFEEANKLRRMTVEVMRRLDAAGVDCFLPDLPGCNESLAALEAQTLETWRNCAEAAATAFKATHILTMRAGAMIAPKHLPGWRYAPQTGPKLLRGMLRAQVISEREAGREVSSDELMQSGREAGLTLAGWNLGAEMVGELENAALEPCEHLHDIAQSDIGGAGLWLRAEPDFDAGQADALAAVIALAFERANLMRLPLTFACGSLTLGGTMDSAPGTSGLLIVSGGNEIRSGAFSGQSRLAARIAKAGFPVFRFDRRGIGDSEGENRGFRKSRKDIASALEAFRALRPQMERVVGFGNCDAASALMLAEGAGCDALVLSNPWTIEEDHGPGPDQDASPPPAAIRARYAEKLKNPSEIARLFKGGVDLRKLAGGLLKSIRPDPAPSSLAEEMQAGLSEFSGDVRILLASADRTAQVFESTWDKADSRIARCEGAGHAYVELEHSLWLERQILAALRA